MNETPSTASTTPRGSLRPAQQHAARSVLSLPSRLRTRSVPPRWVMESARVGFFLSIEAVTRLTAGDHLAMLLQSPGPGGTKIRTFPAEAIEGGANARGTRGGMPMQGEISKRRATAGTRSRASIQPHIHAVPREFEAYRRPRSASGGMKSVTCLRRNQTLGRPEFTSLQGLLQRNHAPRRDDRGLALPTTRWIRG